MAYVRYCLYPGQVSGLHRLGNHLVLLIAAGAIIIAEAGLAIGQNILALLILAFCMIWVLVIPIIVYLVMGDRGQRNQKKCTRSYSFGRRTWHNEQLPKGGLCDRGSCWYSIEWKTELNWILMNEWLDKVEEYVKQKTSIRRKQSDPGG